MSSDLVVFLVVLIPSVIWVAAVIRWYGKDTNHD